MKKLRVGDWVEVRSKEEILATLDKKGRMEGVPFMPQMFQYCGQRFKIYRSAHKTCDWVYTQKSRLVPNGVHLETRCDGEAYRGCQTACLIYWKEAWLKRVNNSEHSAVSSEQLPKSLPALDPLNPATLGNSLPRPLDHGDSSFCTEEDVWAATQVADQGGSGEPRYVCQATQVFDFTKPLPWWNIRQYVEDCTSGNVALGEMLQGFIYASYTSLIQAGIGLGPPLRWIYNRFQALWGGMPHPRISGRIPAGQSTPTLDLNLQPGEMVRVKSIEGVRATLDTHGKNRGLGFDPEMVPYCGGTYRVKARVTKYIDEKTGKFITMKKPAIMLEGVCCQGRYSDHRMFCPRSIISWWHEIWLERAPKSANSSKEPKG
jgi:hypothetical protein